MLSNTTCCWVGSHKIASTPSAHVAFFGGNFIVGGNLPRRFLPELRFPEHFGSPPLARLGFSTKGWTLTALKISINDEDSCYFLPSLN